MNVVYDSSSIETIKGGAGSSGTEEGNEMEANQIAEKIFSSMQNASMDDWKALNALMKQVEKNDLNQAMIWIETGKLPTVMPENKKAARRKPLDLAAPYTSVILNVSYAQKDEAKAYGAKWHPTRKFWYFPAYQNTPIPEGLKKFI